MGTAPGDRGDFQSREHVAEGSRQGEEEFEFGVLIITLFDEGGLDSSQMEEDMKDKQVIARTLIN